MASDHAAIKKQLRGEFRQKRAAIAEEDRVFWNGRIRELVLSLPEVQGARVIFVYLSHTSEVDTREIIGELIRAGKSVLTPSPNIKVQAEEAICRLSWMDGDPDDLVPVEEQELGVEAIDCILVPGLVWSPEGYRIGFGGGYFDRLLEAAQDHVKSVGLAFECQVVDELPVDKWDRPVDVLVTERGEVRRPNP